jgi:hypothetical protein
MIIKFQSFFNLSGYPFSEASQGLKNGAGFDIIKISFKPDKRNV